MDPSSQNDRDKAKSDKSDKSAQSDKSDKSAQSAKSDKLAKLDKSTFDSQTASDDQTEAEVASEKQDLQAAAPKDEHETPAEQRDGVKPRSRSALVARIRCGLVKKGFALMVIGYMTQLFVFGIWEDNILKKYTSVTVEPYRAFLATASAEQWGWMFLKPFVRNFIIEEIGFVTMMTGFITLELTRRRCSLSISTAVLLSLAALVLVLNPLFRIGLDHATCCVPANCKRFPPVSTTNVTGEQPPITLLAEPPSLFSLPPATCALVLSQPNDGKTAPAQVSDSALPLSVARSLGMDVNWAPCANSSSTDTRHHSLMTEALLRAGAAIHSTANTSTYAKRVSACQDALKTMMGTKPPLFAIHGLPSAAIGSVWCSRNNSFKIDKRPLDATWTEDELRTAAEAEFHVDVCKMKPWWGRGADFGLDELGSAGAGGSVLVIVLQLLFGRFGFFAYAAPSLVGAVIALHYHQNGDRLPVVSLRIGLAACFASFILGAILLALLLLQSAEDTALQAGSHVRLFCGGAEVAIVLLFIGLLETQPAPVRRKCHRGSRCLRRFGVLTLTVWTLQWLDLCLVIVLDTIGQRQAPWSGVASGTRSYEWNVLLVPLVMVPVWSFMLRMWECIGFVGTLEWVMQRIIRPKRKGIVFKQLHSYDVDETEIGTATSTVRIHQICFCCCCCWSSRKRLVVSKSTHPS